LRDAPLARSLSITARQPELRSERCFIMHAVIFGMLGISDEHRRKASPVHICCASAEKAKLEVVEMMETMAAKPRARLVSRILALKDVVEKDLAEKDSAEKDLVFRDSVI
jgi:hypothetical protein